MIVGSPTCSAQVQASNAADPAECPSQIHRSKLWILHSILARYAHRLRESLGPDFHPLSSQHVKRRPVTLQYGHQRINDEESISVIPVPRSMQQGLSNLHHVSSTAVFVAIHDLCHALKQEMLGTFY